MANEKVSMTGEQLRASILAEAISGRLVEQRAEDGDARELLAEIRREKARLVREKKIKKTRPLPPVTEEEQPFAIPESWEWVRLGELVLFENGDRSTQYPKKADYCATGIPFFGAKDMGRLFMSFDEVRFISQEKFNALGNGKLQDGDMVCLLRGSVGKTAIFRAEKLYKTGFICAQMLIIRCFFKEMLWYMVAVMRSPFMKKAIQNKVTGTAVRQIAAKDMMRLPVPLPPLAEQRRIVAKLRELLPLVERYGAAEERLVALDEELPRRLRQSILQYGVEGRLTEQCVTDGDARDLLAKIRREKARLVREKKIKKAKPLPPITDDEKPFDIPANWMWVRLGEIGEFERGAGLKRTETTALGKPCIRYGELYTTYQTKFSQTVSHTSDEVFARCHKVRQNDIVMSLTGENKLDIALAVTYAGTEEIAMGGDMTKLTLFRISPLYMTYVINSPYGIECKRNLATGDIIVHISNVKLANIPVPLPPLPEQKRIVKKIEQLLASCEKLP